MTELCMGVFCRTWCCESFYWGPCCNMALNILLSPPPRGNPAVRTSHMHLGHSYEIFIILRTDSTKNCVPSILISFVMHKGSLMQMKNNTAKKWCKNRFLSSTWRWPPRVETCSSKSYVYGTVHHLYSWVKRKPTWCHLFYNLFNTHSMLNTKWNANTHQTRYHPWNNNQLVADSWRWSY